MKTIGIIGGMSWESSTIYYQLMNRKIKDLLGGFHSCKLILWSVDFAEVEQLQREGNWKKLDELMAEAAHKLELAGAEMIVLSTNTMHLCTPAIEAKISVPFLHIAEATAQAIQKTGLWKVALLGTKFTMEKDFYKDIIQKKYGIEVLIPMEEEREIVHQVIFGELVQGKIKAESKQKYIKIIKNLHQKGAEGVILGCTEIPLLIQAEDVPIPIFDTTKIHVEKAIEWALK